MTETKPPLCVVCLGPREYAERVTCLECETAWKYAPQLTNSLSTAVSWAANRAREFERKRLEAFIEGVEAMLVPSIARADFDTLKKMFRGFDRKRKEQGK